MTLNSDTFVEVRMLRLIWTRADLVLGQISLSLEITNEGAPLTLVGVAVRSQIRDIPRGLWGR